MYKHSQSVVSKIFNIIFMYIKKILKNKFETYYFRYEKNDFQKSNNFSAFSEEHTNKLSVSYLKRKYPEIEHEMDEDLDDLNAEIQKSENYLNKFKKRKEILEFERQLFKK